MNCQMIRVISSPSSSTTVPSTLILSTSSGPLLGKSQIGDVGLLGSHGLGGLAQPGELALGQVALDDAPHAVAADLGLHTQVDAGDAVLAVDPRADRHHG